MTISSKNPHPSFLTSDRLRAILRALREAIDDYNEFVLKDDGMLFMNSKGSDRAWRRLSCLRPRIRQHLEGLPGVEIREIGNLFVIIFDEEFLIHLKRLDSLLLGYTPITISRAIREYHQQQSLFDDDVMAELEKDDVEIPLGKLKPFILGYTVDDAGGAENFYINEQEGQELLSQHLLDISELVEDGNFENAPSNVEEVNLPKTQFIPKNKDLKDRKTSSE